MTGDLPTPCHPVRLLARSQPSAFQVSLAYVFPSCFRSSSLPFPWYIRPQHFPQYVFFISPHRMPVPVQSSLHDLFYNKLILFQNTPETIVQWCTQTLVFFSFSTACPHSLTLYPYLFSIHVCILLTPLFYSLLDISPTFVVPLQTLAFG